MQNTTIFSASNCSELGDFSDDVLALDFCDDTNVRSLCLNACQLLTCEELSGYDASSNSSLDLVYNISVRVLTFLLLGGFAATVDTTMFFENFKSKGVYVGLFAQFILMPILGFISVLIFQDGLKPLIAVMIMMVTSCPGGAVSVLVASRLCLNLPVS